MQTNSKLREALELARLYISLGPEAESRANVKDGQIEMLHATDVLTAISAALAEPVRNYEVGTAEEQEVRFRNYCWNHSSRDKNMECQCPIDAEGKAGCKLTWVQMPYESEA